MNITEQKLKLKQEKRGLIKKLKKGFQIKKKKEAIQFYNL